MFKKSCIIQSQHQISGADKKKLRDLIAKSFVGVSRDDMELLIPLKGASETSRAKLKDSTTVLYMVGGDPMFIDIEARENLYPTVYALWKVPKLLPSLLIHPPVFKYLAGGADLMFPGIAMGEYIQSLSNIKKGDKLSVVLNGYPDAVVAVGEMLAGFDSLKKQSSAMKGKALRCVHVMGDHLWRCGSKEIPQVLNLQASKEGEEGEEGSSNEENDQENREDLIEQSTKEHKEGKQEEEPEATAQMSQVNIKDHNKPKEMTMDELLEYSFLNSLTQINDKDLPILISSFYSSNILPNRPIDTVLDIKKTKHKKLGTFLTEMEMKGLITTAEVSKGVSQLTAINRQHEQYISFRSRLKSDTQVQTEKQKSEQQPTESTSTCKIEVTDFLKPPSSLLQMFVDEGGSKDQLFSVQECRQIVQSYIAKHNLTSAVDGKLAVIDNFLATNLFNNSKQSKAGDTILKKDLLETVLNKMQSFYQIKSVDECEIKKGSVKPIQIVVEKRMGGKKHVTLVSGLENFRISPEETAQDLNKICAASSTVQSLPGKNAGKEVLIQGNVGKTVFEYLVEKYEISKKFIDCKEKSKGGKS